MKNGKVTLLNSILWLLRHMSSVESRFNKRFDKARGTIGKILDSELPEGLSEEQSATARKIIEKTRGHLAGGIDFDDENEENHPIFNDLD